MTERDEKITEIEAALEAAARRSFSGPDVELSLSAPGYIRYLLHELKTVDNRRAAAEAGRTTAWGEIREIREVIDANPEEAAADEVRRVMHELRVERRKRQRAVDALRDLVDCQNGPPLIRYEDEWEEAMKMAESVLRENEG